MGAAEFDSVNVPMRANCAPALRMSVIPVLTVSSALYSPVVRKPRKLSLRRCGARSAYQLLRGDHHARFPQTLCAAIRACSRDRDRADFDVGRIQALHSHGADTGP